MGASRRPRRPSLLHLDLEARALDQFARALEIPSGGGEIAVDENRVDGVEDVALAIAQVQLAAAGCADLAPRIHHAEETCGLETSLGSQEMCAGERRSAYRVEEIERDGVGFQPAGRKSQIDHIVVGFAHPNDSAGT